MWKQMMVRLGSAPNLPLGAPPRKLLAADTAGAPSFGPEGWPFSGEGTQWVGSQGPTVWLSRKPLPAEILSSCRTKTRAAKSELLVSLPKKRVSLSTLQSYLAPQEFPSWAE